MFLCFSEHWNKWNKKWHYKYMFGSYWGEQSPTEISEREMGWKKHLLLVRRVEKLLFPKEMGKIMKLWALGRGGRERACLCAWSRCWINLGKEREKVMLFKEAYLTTIMSIQKDLDFKQCLFPLVETEEREEMVIYS